MKFTVIGAGPIGAAVATILAGRDDVKLVQICDARARALRELHDRVDSPVLRSFQVDARDQSVLDSILRGSDCVIAGASPELNPKLARLCLQLGIPFLDLGSSEERVTEILALDEQAREQSTWIVPNCGLAPGLVNILCLHGMERFDETESVHIRVGDVPLYPEPPFNFRISWSAEKVIEDYTCPVQLVREGKLTQEESLTRLEPISFDAPFDQMEAFCTAGGLSTLARQLEGKVRFFDHKAIRWPGHALQMQFLLGLGFGEDRNIDVQTHLTYRDVLVRRLRSRLGGRAPDAVLLRIVVRGTVEGERKTLVYEMIDQSDDETTITAIERATSLSAATAALLLVKEVTQGGGAQPPENVLPRQRFIEEVQSAGLPIESYWLDGDHAETLTRPPAGKAS